MVYFCGKRMDEYQVHQGGPNCSNVPLMKGQGDNQYDYTSLESLLYLDLSYATPTSNLHDKRSFNMDENTESNLSLSNNQSSATNETLSTNDSSQDEKHKTKSKNHSKKKRRKRSINKDEWIDIKSKRARDSGAEGIGKKGQFIRARKMGVGCSENCRFKCHQRITFEERTAAFTYFWGLKDHTKQWYCLKKWAKQSFRTNQGLDSKSNSEKKKERKTARNVFTFPTKSGEISVCKSMFLGTLDISHQWIRTANRKKLIAMDDVEIIEPDQRGRHKTRRFRNSKTSDDVMDEDPLYQGDSTCSNASLMNEQDDNQSDDTSCNPLLHLDLTYASPTSDSDNERAVDININEKVESNNSLSNDPSNETLPSNDLSQIEKCGETESKSHSKKLRKRPINKDEWMHIKSKRARDSGAECVGKNGQLVRARKMGAGCSENCRFKCHQRITFEERTAAFTYFWGLKDHTKQWHCLKKWAKQKFRTNQGLDSKCNSEKKNERKTARNVFTFPTKSGEISVCKSMFLGTLDISHRWIRTANQKNVIAVDDVEIIEPDQRGRHQTRRYRNSKTSEDVMDEDPLYQGDSTCSNASLMIEQDGNQSDNTSCDPLLHLDLSYVSPRSDSDNERAFDINIRENTESNHSLSKDQSSEINDTFSANDSSKNEKRGKTESKSHSKKLSRKRPINKDEWMHIKSKRARDSGIEYVGKKGQLVRARKMGAGCSENCRFKCHQRITFEERTAAFNYFWGLKDHTKQWLCLKKWAQQRFRTNVDLDSKSNSENKNERKTARNLFTFPTGSGEISVCKSMFLGTLDISDQWIRTANRKKVIAVDDDEIIEPDQRGRHKTRRFGHSKTSKHMIDEDPLYQGDSTCSNASLMNEQDDNQSDDTSCDPLLHLDLTYASPTSYSNNEKTFDINIDENAESNLSSRNDQSNRTNETLSINDSSQNKKCGDTFMRRQFKRKSQSTELNGKRSINKDEWIDIKSKRARDSGTEGIGRKGRLIKARKMGAGCSEKCRFKCQQRITIEERTAAYTLFWGLEDHTKQWICLKKWVKKKLRTNEDLDSNSENDNENEKITKNVFTFPTATGEISVCKTMFLSTLDISNQWIVTANKKKVIAVDDVEIIQKDQRGLHNTRPLGIPKINKDIVRKHIESYPVMESHQCGAKSNKMYLEEGVSIASMYRTYIEKRKIINDDNVVSYQTFAHIFNTEYNYGFFARK